jgi:hypothetical protein
VQRDSFCYTPPMSTLLLVAFWLFSPLVPDPGEPWKAPSRLAVSELLLQRLERLGGARWRADELDARMDRLLRESGAYDELEKAMREGRSPDRRRRQHRAKR